MVVGNALYLHFSSVHHLQKRGIYNLNDTPEIDNNVGGGEEVIN